MQVPALVGLPFMLGLLWLLRLAAWLVSKLPSSLRPRRHYPHHCLVSISFSHYVEKARWALDLSGVPYSEECHSPIWHMAGTLPRSLGASSSVPLLVVDSAHQAAVKGGVLTDSTDILQHLSLGGVGLLDLYPTSEVLGLENYFDKELGPAIRLVAYHHLFPDPQGKLPSLFTNYVDSWWEKRLTVLFFPTVRLIMKNFMGINEAASRKAEAKVEEEFKKVNDMLSDGRRFLLDTTKPTAADITFAALAAVVIQPPQLREIVPIDTPKTLQAKQEELRGTPAGKFVLRMYQEERGVDVVRVKKTVKVDSTKSE